MTTDAQPVACTCNMPRVSFHERGCPLAAAPAQDVGEDRARFEAVMREKYGPSAWTSHVSWWIWCAARNEAAERITALERALDAAFGTLLMYGVPKERARSVANGISVLVTRMDKELAAANARTYHAEQMDRATLQECQKWIAEVNAANARADALATAQDVGERAKYMQKVGALAPISAQQAFDDGAASVEPELARLRADLDAANARADAVAVANCPRLCEEFCHEHQTQLALNAADAQVGALLKQLSVERARADAAMVDRNSYQNRLSMERARADAAERDAERWRAKYHATRRYLRAANKGAELLSKVCQLHTHSVASLRDRLIECERSKP